MSDADIDDLLEYIICSGMASSSIKLKMSVRNILVRMRQKNEEGGGGGSL